MAKAPVVLLPHVVEGEVVEMEHHVILNISKDGKRAQYPIPPDAAIELGAAIFKTGHAVKRRLKANG